MSVQDYHLDADLNISIAGISVAEGCAPSGINNAIRQLMADVKEESGAQSAALAAARSELAATDAAQDTAIAAAQSSADAAQEAAAIGVVSAAIDGLDLVLTFGNGTTSRVQLPAGKSVGDLWLGFDPESKPANVQLYAGQLLSRESYAAHSAFVLGGSRTVLAEDEWQAQVAADGFCPFYSSGDGSTTYRMPLVKGVHPEFVAALAESGQFKPAGLPNITGFFNNNGFKSDAEAETSGAFAFNTGSGCVNIGGSGGTVRYGFSFDASRSNPIYGNSDTVQPPSLTFLLGEYVVGSVAAIGDADAASLLASMTTLESSVGALESEVRELESGVGRSTAYLVETWRSGQSWYRKWSDGWIEQGGGGVYNGNTLTFHTPFSNTNYVFIGAVNRTDSSSNSGWVGACTKTATTCYVFALYDGGSAATGHPISWSACGY